ncbi:MAG TPA: LysE family transporter [Niabella sp.]|nr:LysE family transporter [Niabella sp.]HOZ98100.1 LysE family transporter [Niabella sp.]HQW16156.1 LysE family transporter [Niabella sp.]HQX21368.1 LysE family transporter [Niabella sp.]HRB08151.1 LysE family transporter [Niabella sp.]
MKGSLKIFFTGMLVSFLGTLPLGTLNIAALQISIAESVYQAILFSFGALTAEMVYVRISLLAMDWVHKQKKMFRVLEWLTLLIVVALAVSSFVSALHPQESNNVLLNNGMPSFVLGLVMSAVNPMQIPFWFGWSTVLLTKQVLLPNRTHYNFYTIGIGIGTLFGNSVFIFGGRLVADKLQNNQSVLHYSIAGIFTLTALIQLWRMFVNRKSVNDKIHDIEDKTLLDGYVESVPEKD